MEAQPALAGVIHLLTWPPSHHASGTHAALASDFVPRPGGASTTSSSTGGSRGSSSSLAWPRGTDRPSVIQPSSPDSLACSRTWYRWRLGGVAAVTLALVRRLSDLCGCAASSRRWRRTWREEAARGHRHACPTTIGETRSNIGACACREPHRHTSLQGWWTWGLLGRMRGVGRAKG